MTIVSKYDGTCRKCGGFVPKGTVVDWVRGRGVAHVDCNVERQPMGDGAYVRSDDGYVMIPGSSCNCIDWPCCGHG